VPLASNLVASLDSGTAAAAEGDRSWLAETERRAAQLESGQAELLTWEHRLDRLDDHRA
jgi:hypothetical protein